MIHFISTEIICNGCHYEIDINLKYYIISSMVTHNNVSNNTTKKLFSALAVVLSYFNKINKSNLLSGSDFYHNNISQQT